MTAPPSLRPGEFFGEPVTRVEAPGLKLVESTYPPRCALPRHRHRLPGFRLTLSGGFRETVGARRFEWTAGSLAFHPPDVEHAQTFGAEPTRCFNVEFEPRAWQPWARHETVLARGEGISSPVTRGLAQRLHVELRRADDLSPRAIEALSLELLVAAVRLGRAEPGAPWLPGALELLRASLAAPPTLPEMSRVLRVSPERLVRGFRRALGMTPAEWVRRTRLEVACAALRAGTQSLAEVAAAAGFCDQSHLTREMRRRLGVTPSRFRGPG